MWPRLLIASVSVVTATALTVAIGVLPSAFAAPCTGAAAGIQPPAAPNTGETPALPGGGPPRGQRPAGTNDGAPLPSLGQVPGVSPSAQIDQQAAIATPGQPVPDANPVRPPTPPAPPAPPGTTLVGWVTGPESPNSTVNRFAITGTDLGIMWDNGSGEVLMAFGDTYGYCGVKGQQWRYNVLMRSNDRTLSNTVTASSSPLWTQGLSKQIINSIKFSPTEKGIIPTAGISVGGTQYVNFMSIKSWDSDGRWTTNYSAIAVSPDNGERWGVYPDSVRPASPNSTDRVRYVAGNENFQQGAFLKPGPGDPYIYSFGTPSGRGGAAYISRVLPAGVPDLRRYEYWSSTTNTWVPGNPGAATPVIPGPVSEMSAQFNTYLNQYLVLYGNGANDMVMRTAPAPQGPWSPERLIVPSMQFPGGIYAPFLHPWSTGKELYYNVSLWSAYNVMLMRTVLP